MDLYCQIQQGLQPDLLDRLTGICEADPTIRTARLCLTATRSRRLVATQDLARIFGSILYNLAECRAMRFLFPHDVGTVKRKLRDLNLEGKKDRRGLWVKLAIPDLALLVQVLEACAFTTFYAWVEADAAASGAAGAGGSPSFSGDLEQSYLLVVFSLYDESVELLTKKLPAELIINAVREVGAAEALQVFC